MADYFEVVGLKFVGEDAGLVREIKATKKALDALNKGLDDAQDQTKNFYRQMRDRGRAVEEFGRGIRDIGQSIQALGRAYSLFVTIPIAGSLALATKAAIDFESAFAGVIKTVDGLVKPGTLTELTAFGEQMRQELLELSTIIPATFEEITKIAEIAGQLGVQAGEITDFTRVIAEFAESTNVTSEEGAKAIAQIANVFQVGKDDIAEFADASTNAIVDLGNNFATTEQDILGFFQTFAGAAATYKVVPEDALAIATAFKSVRAQTASSSTGIQKTFAAMSDAVLEGGASLAQFAEVSGQTAQEFARTWESRPALALANFLDGLNEAGGEASGILRDIGLGDQRIIREFLKAASGVEVLYEALDSAAVSFGNFEENGARAIEAARRFATVESEITLLKNEFRALAVVIGENFLPIIRDIIEDIRPFIRALADLAKQNPGLVKTAAALGLIAAAGGPIILTLGGVVTTVGNAIAGLGSLSIGLGQVGLTMEAMADASKLAGNAVGTTAKTMSLTQGITEALTGSFATLKTTVKAAASAFVPYVAIAGAIAVAAAAITALAVATAKANGETEEAVEKYTEAAIALGSVDKETAEAQEGILDLSKSYQDYAEAADAAGLGTEKFSEAQYNLVKATGAVKDSLDPVQAAITAFTDEVSNDNVIVRAFASYSASVNDMVQSAIDFSNSGEELISNLTKVGQTVRDNGENIITYSEANYMAADAIIRNAANHEEARAALIAYFGSTYNAQKALGSMAQLQYRGAEQQIIWNKATGDAIDRTIAMTEATDKAVRQGFGPYIQSFKEATGITGQLTSEVLEFIKQSYQIGRSADDAAFFALTQGELAGQTYNAGQAMLFLSESMPAWEAQIIAAGRTSDAYDEIGGAAKQLTDQQIVLVNTLQATATAFGEEAGTMAAELVGLYGQLAEAQDAGLVEASANISQQIGETTRELREGFRQLALDAARTLTFVNQFGEVEQVMQPLTRETADLAVALGLLTPAQADASLAAQQLSDEMGVLLSELALSRYSAEEQAAAIELLSRGYVDTAGQALALIDANEEITVATLEARDALDAQEDAAYSDAEAMRELYAELIAVAEAQDAVSNGAKDSAREVIRQAKSGGSAARSAKREIDDQAKSFVSFIEKMRQAEEDEDAEPFDLQAEAIGDWEIALLDAASAAGATLEQTALLAAATGELTDEQVKAMLNMAVAQRAIEEIASAYVDGSISADQAAGAIQTLQEQVNSGADINLTQFGVDLTQPMEQVKESAGGAGGAVQTLADVYREALRDMVDATGLFDSAQLLELEVELGIITPEQAESERVANEVIDSMRSAIGILVIDGVPVQVDASDVQLSDPNKFIQDVETAAAQGANVSEAIKVGRAAVIDLQLDVDQAALSAEIASILAASPELSTNEAVAEALVEFGIKDKEKLIDDLEELDERVKAVAPEDGHELIIDKSQVERETIPEVENLEKLLQETVKTRTLDYDYKSVTDAKAEVDELRIKLEALSEETFTATVEITQNVTTNDDDGDTTTEPDIPSNYHGGLFLGKPGRDTNLTRISSGEYIMPNYAMSSPLMLPLMDALRSNRGDIWKAFGRVLGHRFAAGTTYGGDRSTVVNNDNKRIESREIVINRPTSHQTRVSLRDYAFVGRQL